MCLLSIEFLELYIKKGGVKINSLLYIYIWMYNIKRDQNGNTPAMVEAL